MKTTTIFQKVSVSADGNVEAKILYATESEEWAKQLEEYICQDWEGTRLEKESARNKRSVIVVFVEEETHKAWCERVDGRRNGLPSSKVVVNQIFDTVSEAGRRLGVSAGYISNSLGREMSKRRDASDYASIIVRGVRLAYYDDFQAAQLHNSGE